MSSASPDQGGVEDRVGLVLLLDERNSQKPLASEPASPGKRGRRSENTDGSGTGTGLWSQEIFFLIFLSLTLCDAKVSLSLSDLGFYYLKKLGAGRWLHG